jgi:competence protein ComEC
MLMVVGAALWFNRLTSISHVLCTALGVVVVIDPWAVLWPGFWLSFGAVAIILYATVGRTTPRDTPPAAPGMPHVTVPPTRRERMALALRVGAHTQYVVTLGLVPITMLLFGQVSVVSPLANAVAIPLISLVVTPLALVGSMLPQMLAVPLLVSAHALVEGLALCLQWFSGMRYAVWSAPVPPFWLFCWAMLGTIWLLAPRGWPARWLGLATWIPLLAAEPAHPAPGRMTVTAFDVGQGMALLIETSGHRLLYDAGPAYTPESNAGSRVVLPYLRARGIATLDGMVISHSDADHAGGALSVLDGVATGWVLSSLSPQHAIARAARQHVPCAAGQHWIWDGVRFEILHPQAASYANHALKPNARTCALKITANGKSILLAGDIEAEQEAQLVDGGAQALRADVLLAPHHGSGTSSTREFLLAVRPQAAIFQVGHRNRYRHPKKEVYDRYGAMHIRRYRTDQAGALTLEFDETIRISSYRQTHARYWHVLGMDDN